MRRFPLASLAVLLFAAMAFAADAPQDLEKKSGKELFKISCKHCHIAEAPAGEYTPMTLIQEQWETFFSEKYVETHQAVIDSTRGAKPVTDLITPTMLEKIRKFAIDGAADSEHPMTCG